MRLAMDLDTLQSMTAGKLDELFAQSPAGPLPDGPTDGTILLDAPNHLAYSIARILRRYVWRGKTFNAEKGLLYNRFPTLNAISADVSIGPSVRDQAPCIVLDYRRDAIVRDHVRDELRQVAPGLYLGIAYQHFPYSLRETKTPPFRQLVHFALTTTTDDAGHV